MNAFAAAGLVVAVLLGAGTSLAQAPRVSAEGTLPPDSRLGPLEDLDGYFPFTPPKTLDQWRQRRTVVRQQLQTAVGLWPMPERTPLNAVIHGRIDQGDYTIEKVYFESLPGFFVTGNLYRPKHASGRTAGILCPHGHWNDGRFHDCGADDIRPLLESGAETCPDGGRSPLQARCVHLARMGAVVFQYDMIGYADSRQISFEIAHRFATQRPAMNATRGWGLFSPQAESHLQSVMGLQTYSSIRALDFLESLDDVDPRRLAATGASGGGTQTFMLAALDDRLAAAFPAVMVSTGMQGGCTCENCCLLRIDTGNVEIAALFAPKPQGMTAADDWTKDMERTGFPELVQLYSLYGAADHVHLTSRLDFDHNDNQVGRTAMYRLFQRALDLQPDFHERDYDRLDAKALTVWGEGHPAPVGGDEVERRILATWHELTSDALERLVPIDEDGWDRYRAVVSAGLDVVIGRTLLPQLADGATSWDPAATTQHAGFLETAGWIRQHQHDECLPVVFLQPDSWNGKVVVWLTGAGKNGLYEPSGTPRPEVRSLLGSGFAVLGADLLYQGEFLEDGTPITQTRRVSNPREAAAYTLGYNRSLAAQRIHDVMTLVASLRHLPGDEAREFHVVGLGPVGPIVATASPWIAAAVAGIYAETRGFRYGGVRDIRAVDFLPGGARYFDLPGFISLAGDADVVLAEEPAESMHWLQALFAHDRRDGSVTSVAADGFATTCVSLITGRQASPPSQPSPSPGDVR
ncbi:MAG: acetylxylan esterase [Planctomycetia bacterium]